MGEPWLEVGTAGRTVVRIRLGNGPAMQAHDVEWLGDTSALSVSLGEDRRDAEALRRWLENLMPEGMASVAYRQRALHRLREEGITGIREPNTAARIWGNSEMEYPGAVDVAAFDGAGNEIVAEAAQGGLALDPGRMLDTLRRSAWEVAEGTKHRDPGDRYQAVSLSGMRGKTGVYLDGDPGEARWKTAMLSQGRASTHVVKLEDSRDNLGEAAMESLVQTLLGEAGVGAARTWAWDVGGRQVVISERSDRRRRADGTVDRIHQEDWAQGAGLSRGEKMHHDCREPMLEGYVALVRQGGTPEGGAQSFDAALASVLAGHTDLHRKNAGLTHTWPGHWKAAPMYDASSSSGRSREFTRDLAVRVGNASQPDEVGREEVVGLGRSAGLGEAEACARARELAGRLEAALPQAVAACKAKDAVTEVHRDAFDERRRALEQDLIARCGRIAIACAAPQRARSTARSRGGGYMLGT